MGTVRTRQAGIKIEAAEGVEESLTGTEFGGNRKSIQEALYVANYERELIQVSMSQLPNLKGERYIKNKWEEELVGGGIATAAPWHATLQAMGFSKTQLKKFSFTEASGHAGWRIGQTFGNNATQGSATKTGIFVCIVGSILVYLPVTGTFVNTDSLFNYGGVSQQNLVISSAITNGGYMFAPISESDSASPASVTTEIRHLTERYTGIGCRGQGGLSIKRSQPLLINCEFMGAYVPDTDGYSPRTASAVTGVPGFSVAPSMCLGVPLTFRTGTTDFNPVLTELSIDFGNTLANRPTIGASLANSGFLATRITDRKPKVKVDPEYVIPSGGFNFAKKFLAGETFEILTQVGDSTNGNGLVIVRAPTAQLIGDLTFGDRDKIKITSADAMLTGSADDELVIYHVFTV